MKALLCSTSEILSPSSMALDTAGIIMTLKLLILIIQFHGTKHMDCCRWSGVTCDEVTAHVIRLDLKCSGLQGILHSNNSLFSLAHLQSLILSHNLFDDSEISSQFGKFSNMVHLDLSDSGFTGHAPLQLSHLSNLVTLDLSRNYDLKLETSSWKRTLANLTNLKELFLNDVDMSSTSPDSFMNLSTSLTSLDLSNSDLQGKLPENILSLPNLQRLDLSYNPNLNGSFIQYNWSSPLKVLNLSASGVVIDLPHLCRKLKYLHILSLSNYNFLKLSPTLLDNCTQITSLDLSFSDIGGYIPWSSILNLQQLTYLDLLGNNFVGPIPEICSNSTKNSFSCVSSKHQLVGSPPLNLKSLYLYGNELNGTIPSWLYSLPSLQYLDLSSNKFSGRAPLQLSHLSNLVALDLSGNDGLKLETSSWKRTVANLTSLKELFLGGVDMSSTSPDSFMNLSTSLTSLDLGWCDLRGKFPENVLSLPNLQLLDLSYNSYLNGSFPQYNWSSPLKVLNLSASRILVDPYLCRKFKYLHILGLHRSNFIRLSPTFLDDCTQITSLDLSSSYIGGYIPWSSNLNIQQLTHLDLSYNNFVGPIPDICSNSTKNSFSCVSSKHQLVSSPPLNLKYLDLSDNELNGTIPSWLYSLPSLQYLDLSSNKFSGSIQEFQHNSLEFLKLSSNNLQGSFPRSIFQQVNLTDLLLSSNNLSGVVQFDQFSKLKKLYYLHLSNNSLSLVSNSNNNNTLSNTLSQLYLSSCGISEFPYSLRSLENLGVLDLSNNQIEGSVPQWLWNMGKDSLHLLDISHNSLTQIDQIPWKNLQYINLRSNLLQGHLPIPPPYTIYFSISNNTLDGEISHLICNLSSLYILDLSNNNLSGNIPQCLGDSSLITVLDLHKNKLHGIIPSHFAEGNYLEVLNLNENQLEGSLPKSLLNCQELVFLDIGNNKINGSFPWWLESLLDLQVLILRSNRFQGPIGNPKVRHPFQSLRIMDLSGNEFTGHLPQKYFKNFVGMMNASSNYLTYMEAQFREQRKYYVISLLTIKGNYVELEKIQTMLIVIDFSRNNFTGEIPELLGKLNSLKGLNFSHNKISGSIPPSLGNLTNLEWLDLSSNKLGGKIPWQLATNLNQLQVLNLSSNKLEGLIPRSRQFDTFTNDSYKENWGLCGFPISESCNENTTHQFQQEDDEEHVNGFDWKIVLMGFGSGMVIGISVGYMFLSDKIIHGLVKTVKGE